MARKLPGISPDSITRSDSFAVPPEELVIIGLDTEDDEVFKDERATWELDPGFVLNIMELGVVVPVTVTVRGGRLVVVDGRQRVRAAREANIRFKAAGNPQIRVPIQVDNLSDEEVMMTGISLNEARRGDLPHVRAAKATRLYRKLRDKSAVAKAFCVSIPTVGRWIRYDEEACEEVKQAVSRGEIGFSRGIDLSTLPAAAQREALQPPAPTTEPSAAPATHEPRPTRANRGVKHSTLREMLKREAEPPPQEYLALIRWIAEGTPLPADHPMAQWASA